MRQEEPLITVESNISANLNREDRAYIEKIDARIFSLLGGKHVREIGDTKTLEQVWDLVKARGTYLRATAAERNELRELDFEKFFGSQFEKQVGMLRANGFVDEKGNIVDSFDGEEYPLPTKEQVMHCLEGKQELLERKMKQGFGRWLLVPIGMKLVALTDVVATLVLTKHAKGELKYPGGAKISTRSGFWMGQPAREWCPNRFSENGRCTYYVTSMPEDTHRLYETGGSDKAAYVRTSSEIPGWDILLLETNLVLPRQDAKDEVIHGRTRIKAGMNAFEYLSLLGKGKENQYYGEVGMTLEAELMLLATSVMETGELVDTIDHDGCANLCLGSFSDDPVHRETMNGAVGKFSSNASRVMQGSCWIHERSSTAGFRSAVKL